MSTARWCLGSDLTIIFKYQDKPSEIQQGWNSKSYFTGWMFQISLLSELRSPISPSKGAP